MGIALTVLGFFKKLPWQAYALVGLALAGVFLYKTGYNNAKTKYTNQMTELVTTVQAAQAQARAAQEQVVRVEQARLDALARSAENANNQTRAVVLDANQRFIAERGVQNNTNSCQPGPTGGTADSNSAAVSTGVPTTVIVDTPDVRACGLLYNYAVNAHNWALQLPRPEENVNSGE